MLPQTSRQESPHSVLPHLHGYCGSGGMSQKNFSSPMKVSLSTQRGNRGKKKRGTASALPNSTFFPFFMVDFSNTVQLIYFVLLFVCFLSPRNASMFYVSLHSCSSLYHLKQKQLYPDCECFHKSAASNMFSCSLTEPQGHSEMISRVGVDVLPDPSINCHRILNATHSVSSVGPFQRTDRWRSYLCWF